MWILCQNCKFSKDTELFMTLILFFLSWQLGGCGILGVGIWLAVTQGNFATLSSSFPSLSAANLLIATGTIVMIVGFLGCIGAIKENKYLLLSVSTNHCGSLVSSGQCSVL